MFVFAKTGFEQSKFYCDLCNRVFMTGLSCVVYYIEKYSANGPSASAGK